MVRLERWNAYWEAYSTCCADELEGLAKQLEEPSSAAGYRRVLLTLSNPAFPSSSVPPTEATNSATTAPAAPDHLPVQVEDPSFSPISSSREDNKAVVSQTHSPLSTGTAGSASSSRPPPPLPTPHSRETSVSSSSYSYSSSYSSYASSYISHSRSSRNADSAAKAAHADDGIDALSFLHWALDDLLYHYAHRFGAVEHLDTRDSSTSAGALSTSTARVIVSVQFTTAEAAGLFLRWADGLSVADVIAAYRRETQAPETASGGNLLPVGRESVVGTRVTALATGMLKGGTTTPQNELGGRDEAWWNTLEEASRRWQLCLIAKLAPHDPRRIAAKLLLGPNVMVSTPLVKSLFSGLFDVTHMEYRTDLRAFNIEFANKKECRLALHALQCSLWRVFGAPLIFT
ncbi:conserved hypothetical protein [Leishmania braziliensis MHOM/BR/75/M2904]|uniref:Uncharacterized protein n=2 Tax=Leishmania braziliensis TaxID=5660 RepID=A4HAM8_LEIBR|nr:conserved hypothetical protein [Leishmania braziliensis MHOM/BR/75/M2904]KAI5686377.1 hypothetical protein MNV84_02948 [Leishmania braziliensis]CAJ2471119.1 unnamed protein product [Leishmania braziliensis]CAJ2471730.1 unnamed protein product [Leishmania braziliensis]CAM38459.1 conserved hypothetical protein [Leishmania braziliensis MHOM/BR/75/M2904]SYZ65108.1 hypothetical_protein [Leishmania braziliensis MHOM/BR/75/M2904]